MEINHAAPATATGEVQISADPLTVFSVISAIDEWPTWNPEIKSARIEGAVEPGSLFRWKSGPGSITSTLEVVDPPREIGWTGRTMGIEAIHVFTFTPKDGGTLAHSEESWQGIIPSVLKSYSRKTLDKTIKGVLSHLKAEAERRTATG